jgi:hypothetical protein
MVRNPENTQTLIPASHGFFGGAHNNHFWYVQNPLGILVEIADTTEPSFAGPPVVLGVNKVICDQVFGFGLVALRTTALQLNDDGSFSEHNIREGLAQGYLTANEHGLPALAEYHDGGGAQWRVEYHYDPSPLVGYFPSDIQISCFNRRIKAYRPVYSFHVISFQIPEKPMLDATFEGTNYVNIDPKHIGQRHIIISNNVFFSIGPGKKLIPIGRSKPLLLGPLPGVQGEAITLGIKCLLWITVALPLMVAVVVVVRKIINQLNKKNENT